VLKEKAAAIEKSKATQQPKKRTSREIVFAYLFDRGDEVLELAYAQYPAQTDAIITRIAELIQSGEITSRISGGELLALFRSVGLNVHVNTTIKVEDKGKLISFSDKLKQQND
jgi:DNA-binding TFAR19-related protein (PDSD5 family)